MKDLFSSKTKRVIFFSGLTLNLILIGIFAKGQTMGTLTFSSGTFAPSANYGTKHVLAVWIENTANPSVFIKTKAKYGNEDDHLTSWLPKSGGNVVDAVTGATLTTYINPISVSWNATNVARTVVPDGNYNVFIEMGWGSNKTTDHAVTSFNFTKGPTAQHITPAGTANYTNVALDWTPVSTLAGVTENLDNLCVYPNPSNGLIHLNFSRNLSSASVNVVNSSGKSVFSERYYRLSAGSKIIDLRKYPDGLYFIQVKSQETVDYTYKVMLNHSASH